MNENGHWKFYLKNAKKKSNKYELLILDLYYCIIGDI